VHDRCLPESLEPAKMRIWKKYSVNCAIDEKVVEVLSRLLPNGGLQQGLPPLHPSTPSPSETVRWSGGTFIERYTYGSPSPIHDITVSVVCSTNRWRSTGLAY
jgi:hypothetical protein